MEGQLIKTPSKYFPSKSFSNEATRSLQKFLEQFDIFCINSSTSSFDLHSVRGLQYTWSLHSAQVPPSLENIYHLSPIQTKQREVFKNSSNSLTYSALTLQFLLSIFTPCEVFIKVRVFIPTKRSSASYF